MEGYVVKISGDSRNDRFQRKSWTVEDARETLLIQANPIGMEEVELLQSLGRRLAEEIVAKEPIPHFRRSGMDGFALRSEDISQASLQSPVELEIIEQIPCGIEPLQKIMPGKASRIMTGGMVPTGADAVIMLEMTEEITRADQTYVIIRKPIIRGVNITPIGEEARNGTVMLKSGEHIGPGQMAILASLGYSRVSVFHKPKVAILSTGTELLQVSESLQMGKIRNSNSYMLAAQVRSAGGEPVLVGQVPDHYELAERMIYELLSSDVDMLLTTGGVSVGDYDIMADFFKRWEGTTLFIKSRCDREVQRVQASGKTSCCSGYPGTPRQAMSGSSCSYALYCYQCKRLKVK